MPKELIPVLKRPLIDFAVSELFASGITEIIVITAPWKKPLEDYFSRLRSRGLLGGEIRLVIQDSPLGLGHAVLQAAPAVGREPFALLLPDELLFADPPGIKQLIARREALGGGSLVALEPVPLKDRGRYGIAVPSGSGEDLILLKGLVEKPHPEKAPSNLAVTGRYILEPEVFPLIEKTPPGKGGEIQLTDALNELARSGQFYGLALNGRRFDAGMPEGLLQAALFLAGLTPGRPGNPRDWYPEVR